MKPRSEKATPEELERYRKLKELPCIACWIKGLDGCGKHTIQHMTSGGRRISNFHTYPLGGWHHQAKILQGYTGAEMRRKFGPSFGESKAAFETIFGREEELLEMTNKILEGM